MYRRTCTETRQVTGFQPFSGVTPTTHRAKRCTEAQKKTPFLVSLTSVIENDNHNHLVDIVSLCSNKSTTSVTAAQLRQISDSTGGLERDLQPRVKRTWNRLSDDQRINVASRYEAGATTTQLAKEYGVAKSTIIGILRSAQVVVRRQPLTPEQVSEAARLYREGLSLSQVATRLGVNQETMRVAVIRAGVALREPTKSRQA